MPRLATTVLLATAATIVAAETDAQIQLSNRSDQPLTFTDTVGGSITLLHDTGPIDALVLGVAWMTGGMLAIS